MKIVDKRVIHMNHDELTHLIKGRTLSSGWRGRVGYQRRL